MDTCACSRASWTETSFFSNYIPLILGKFVVLFVGVSTFDLSKPLISFRWIEYHRSQLSYEFLHRVHFTCWQIIWLYVESKPIHLDGWGSCAHCTQRMALGLPLQYSAQIKRVMFGIIRQIISRIKMSQAFVVILNSGSAGIVSKTTSQNSHIDRIVYSDFVRSPSRSRKL